MARAVSITPMVGCSCSAARPLKSGDSRSAQLVTGRPVRSGRMPSVSPLVIIGSTISHSLGPSWKLCPPASLA